MEGYDDIEFDEHTPLCLMPRDVQEFAAWVAILPPEAIKQIRLKIEELSKKDRYKNNQDKKLAARNNIFSKLTPQEREALKKVEAEIKNTEDFDWN